MADEAFELRVQPNGESQYGLALFQKPHRDHDRTGKAEEWQLVVRVHGQPMKAVLDQVLATIKKAGYKASELSRTREKPFHLTESSACAGAPVPGGEAAPQDEPDGRHLRAGPGDDGRRGVLLVQQDDLGEDRAAGPEGNAITACGASDRVSSY